MFGLLVLLSSLSFSLAFLPGPLSPILRPCTCSFRSSVNVGVINGGVHGVLSGVRRGIGNRASFALFANDFYAQLGEYDVMLHTGAQLDIKVLQKCYKV